MNDPKIILYRVTIIFQMGCLLMALYWVVLFSGKYDENSDAISITMKKFNENPSDKYPTFSLCFKGDKFHWYHDEIIFKTYSLNATQYEQMLKGENAFTNELNETSKLYRKMPASVGDSFHDNFELFHLQLSDFLTELEFVTEKSTNDMHISKDSQNTSAFDSHFYLAYQTPDTICFTRNEVDLLDTIRMNDLITLNSSIIGNHMFNGSDIQIFIHYPGQLMKSFDKPKYTAKFPYFISSLKGADSTYPNVLEFKISQARKLNKRSNSNPPCNKDIPNFDHFLQLQLIRRLGCVPIYWKSALLNITSFEECKSPATLRNAYGNISDVKSILEMGGQPCDEMILLSIDSVNSNPTTVPKDIAIDFQYTEKMYEEIVYTKAIGFESWLSNVGGFVGIFLGYSMMQIPDALAYILEFFYRQKDKKLNGVVYNYKSIIEIS